MLTQLNPIRNELNNAEKINENAERQIERYSKLYRDLLIEFSKIVELNEKMQKKNHLSTRGSTTRPTSLQNRLGWKSPQKSAFERNINNFTTLDHSLNHEIIHSPATMGSSRISKLNQVKRILGSSQRKVSIQN